MLQRVLLDEVGKAQQRSVVRNAIVVTGCKVWFGDGREGQSATPIIYRSDLKVVGKKAFDGESVSDTLALSFCFDVQLKTLRTKTYVICPEQNCG